MFCLKCGKEIPEESVYCLFCGIKLPALPPQSPASPPAEPLPIDPVPKTQPVNLDIWDDSDFELPTFADDDELEPTEPIPPKQHCAACGRELPATSISDLCITCLNNRSFVASSPESEESLPDDDPRDDSPANSRKSFQLDLDLDAEYPSAFSEPPQQPSVKKTGLLQKKWFWIALIITLAVAGLALIFVPAFISDSDGSGANSSQSPGASNMERKVTSYAREITKNACANPDSVSFHKDAKLEQNDGVWTVTETFDRNSRQGEFVTTTYRAVLRLDSTQSSGYVAILLQIDDTIMFDYSKS